MTDVLRVLLIEDTDTDVLLLERALRREWPDLNLHRVETADALRAALEADEWDVVLSDYSLPGFSATEALAIHQELAPDLPFIVVSGLIATEDAVELMRTDADDFVRKDDVARLAPSIRRELNEAAGRRERKRLEAELRDREESYRTLYRNTPAMMHSIDREGRLVSVSDYWLEHLGYSIEEVMGRKSVEFLTGDSRRYAETVVLPDFMRTGTCTNVEYQFVKKNGEIIDTLLSATAERDADGTFVRSLAVVTDVTEKKRAERELVRTNRALRTISQGNQMLVRATSEEQLVFDMCRIAVEEGGYRMAWIGFADEDPAKMVKPIAHYGYEKGYLEDVVFTWADDDRGRGPVGTAIRTSQTVVVRDLAEDTAFEPWRDAAIKRGFRSSISLPLKDEADAFGAMSVFADQVAYFTDQEIDILTEMANDVAYGILALREAAHRRRAEEAVARSKMNLQAILDATDDTIGMVDVDGRMLAINRAGARRFGCEPHEMIGQPFSTFYDEDDARLRRKGLDEVLKTGHPVVREATWKGQIREARLHPVYSDASKPVAATVFSRDVTELRRSEEQLRKLSRAVEQSSAIVIITDIDGAIEYVNPKFAEVTGYTCEEVIGKNPRILNSGEQTAELYETLWRTLAAGLEWRGEFYNRRKDGSLYLSSASISPIRDADGKTTHFVGTAYAHGSGCELRPPDIAVEARVLNG